MRGGTGREKNRRWGDETRAAAETPLGETGAQNTHYYRRRVSVVNYSGGLSVKDGPPPVGAVSRQIGTHSSATSGTGGPSDEAAQKTGGQTNSAAPYMC